MIRSSIEVVVSDPSQVGEARRAAQRLAAAAGLDDSIASDAAIVATELATNLVRHASGGGRLVMRGDAGTAIEILAIDSGPGMDYDRCLRDGYSTIGTAGQGLGSVARQAAEFDVHTSVRGSVLWARIGAAQSSGARIGAVNLCHPGEVICGDDWRVDATDGGLVAMVADGLGHGPNAAQAANRATESLRDEAPAQMLQRAHALLSGTRGGAIACVRIDRARAELTLASVGNVSALLLTREQSRGLPAQNGTVGAHFPSRIHETSVAFADGAYFVLHSDGIQSRWSLDGHPGLLTCHPAVIAGVIARDFRRGRDDATVLVLQWGESP
jgi:anti-sigma regulatory factor (Ser/Thr protein kinase)